MDSYFSYTYFPFMNFSAFGRFPAWRLCPCTRGALARQGEATSGLYLFLRKILAGVAENFGNQNFLPRISPTAQITSNKRKRGQRKPSLFPRKTTFVIFVACSKRKAAFRGGSGVTGDHEKMGTTKLPDCALCLAVL
jgi:hypothetical protein